MHILPVFNFNPLSYRHWGISLRYSTIPEQLQNSNHLASLIFIQIKIPIIIRKYSSHKSTLK